MPRSTWSSWLLTIAALTASLPAHAAFVEFEAGQVRPLALSPDGTRLFAVNTPDDRLEIFSVDGGGITKTGSVPVGLEPVAVAARTNAEVWVVNHLSDSISIVDVGSTPARVVRTLLVGDEPRDIVFAGPGGSRAFITTAHRGQNDPDDPQLTTPGIGRADVWVFDATNLGTSLGGDRLAKVTLFGDTPRALAASPDGSIVYAAVFHSGNQTTALSEGVVCNGGAVAAPCTVSGVSYPGGLPAPNTNFQGTQGPETGLIVKLNPASGHWEDRLGRNWDNGVRFSLPDEDVFAIDANATPPVETAAFTGVGTVLFNMATNPVSGKVYVTNSEARNEVRFEGPGTFGGSTVRGHLHEMRITVLDGANVLPRHLNKHIDYGPVPSPAGVSDASLAIPLGMAVSSDGATLYVAALGSSKVGVFDTAALENDTFVPSAASHILMSGGGPSGLVLDEPRGRLYVLTRFDDAVSVVSIATRSEQQHVLLHNPEPLSITNGRRFLYDAAFTSSNGEASCAACHVFGEFDSLAWDLGNPDDVVAPDPNLQLLLDGSFILGGGTFHPLKGPMTTQTLRGMAHDGQMHWRGDRTPGTDPRTDPNYEDGAFKKFNVAFSGLLGRSGPLTAAEMQAFTDFILQVAPPPNPIRALDRSFTPDQQAGFDLFQGRNTDFFGNCNFCHRGGGGGIGGTSGVETFEGETQNFKIPPLRNVYTKVGMFGMPAVPFFQTGDNGFKGDQVRGFGFLHDGTCDTLFRFHGASVFGLNDSERAHLEAFVLAIDGTFAPVVGQQVTLDATNGATVGPRIGLLLARAAVNECDVVVKGTLAGLQRGWVRTAAGTFRSDRSAEPLLNDAQLRAHAATAGQERTYTAVPPGSGQRIGVDRDEDGFLDRDELDAGSDPENPGDPVPTTTSTTSTSTTTLAYVLVETTRFTMDDVTPGNSKLSFSSSTKRSPTANRIVPPPPGSPEDPRNRQVLFLQVRNPITGEAVNMTINGFWTLLGTEANPKGYRFKAGTPTTSAKLKHDRLSVKTLFFGFTLDEPSQGRLGIIVAPSLTPPNLYAEAPAKLAGNPPSSAASDHPGRFVAQHHAPPPLAPPF